MAIAGAITSWGVAKRARWETGSPRLTSAPDAPHEFAKQFCHTFFADVRKWLLTVELVWSVVILYLVATMIFHADFSGAPTDFLSRIGIRMAVSLAVTAIAVVVGLWLAINRGAYHLGEIRYGLLTPLRSDRSGAGVHTGFAQFYQSRWIFYISGVGRRVFFGWWNYCRNTCLSDFSATFFVLYCHCNNPKILASRPSST